jgi:hypothetical protein
MQTNDENINHTIQDYCDSLSDSYISDAAAKIIKRLKSGNAAEEGRRIEELMQGCNRNYSGKLSRRGALFRVKGDSPLRGKQSTGKPSAITPLRKSKLSLSVMIGVVCVLALIFGVLLLHRLAPGTNYVPGVNGVPSMSFRLFT